MRLIRTEYHADTLAAALLPKFKEWARIDHNDDDALATSMLAAVIASLERQWDIAFAPARYEWRPYETNAVPPDRPYNAAWPWRAGYPSPSAWTYVPVPIRGISTFKVLKPPYTGGANDVSANFVLAGDLNYATFGQTFLQAKAGTTGLQPDWQVILETEGIYHDPEDTSYLPPALWNVVARYALFVWENRESAMPTNLQEVPDFHDRAWAVFWAPRV